MRPDSIQRDRRTKVIIKKFKGTRCNKSCPSSKLYASAYLRGYEYKPWREKTKKIGYKMPLEKIKGKFITSTKGK